MVKRFPSFSPVPTHNSEDEAKSQFRQIINCSKADIDGNLKTRAEIRDLFQDPVNGLIKVDGDNFALQKQEDGTFRNPPMPNDLLSMVIALGLLDSTTGAGDNQVISWNKHSEKYMSGEVNFSTTIHNAMLDKMKKSSDDEEKKSREGKQSVGDQILLELLIEIWEVMDFQTENPDANNFLKSSEIIKRLQERGWDKEVNKYTKRSISLVLRYATIMGLFETDGDGKNRYRRGDEGQFRRLRKVCVYYNAFNILRRLGPTHPCLSQKDGVDFVNDLFRYHLFRECGGQYKHRGLSDDLRKSMKNFAETIRDQYRESRKITHDNNHFSEDWPEYNSLTVAKNKPLNMVENYQGMLKDAIKQKFDIDTDEARGRLSVDILSRAYEKCESKEETLAFFRRNSGGRYDRTILNELAKSHGSDQFTLPGSFKPHDWQKQASESWKDNSYKGIVAAVTGSGKTIMAVYAIAEYVRVYPNAIFSIIVPTKVLMKQWAEVISGLLGLDDSLIGLRGDGFKDSFSDGKRVLISIVNSARGGVLEADIDQLPEDTKHVIIADECHRYGSESNRTVFNTRSDAILGLSATPPSESEEESDDSDDWTNAEIVIDLIGKVFYNLRYKEALEQKLISPFEVIYLSIPLEPAEDSIYDNHTKRIGKAIKGIRSKYGHMMSKHNNRSLDEQLNAIQKQVPELGQDRDVRRYREEAMARRKLVWNTPNRKYAYLSVIEKSYSENPDSQVMVFHEQISQLEDIVSPIDMRGGGGESHAADIALAAFAYRAEYAMYHSKQSPLWNSISMDMFRGNTRKIMLSVKALAEGVDVPSADVGIIRVSTGSVRQRIQTIGRMLRKSGAEKATIYIFHVTKSNGDPTVDCNILRTVDWEEQLGEAEILHSNFIPPNTSEDVGEMTVPSQDIEGLKRLVPLSWEDRMPPAEVDVSELEFGDDYPGRFDGIPIGVDASGKAFLKNRDFGRLLIEDERLQRASKFVYIKKGGGKILLTPQGHLITRVKGEPTYFLGTMPVEELHNLEAESLEAKKEDSSNKPRTFEEMFG